MRNLEKRETLGKTVWILRTDKEFKNNCNKCKEKVLKGYYCMKADKIICLKCNQKIPKENKEFTRHRFELCNSLRYEDGKEIEEHIHLLVKLEFEDG